MNPDYVALAVMVLLVLSVLVAWWYASRPRKYLPYNTLVVARVSGIALGSKLQIGSGANAEYVRVIATNRSTNTVTTEPLVNTHASGEVVVMNRAQRRAKRWS